MIRTRPRRPPPAAPLCTAALLILMLPVSCHPPMGRVNVLNEREPSVSPTTSSLAPQPSELEAIPRYGGAVLVAQDIPGNEPDAGRWARHMGTLVAYETYLRRFPQGSNAEWIRDLIRQRFIPQEESWQEAWQGISKLDLIEGAVCDPEAGLILFGESGSRLPPFFYDDVIVALKVALGQGRCGVTMVEIFPARSTEGDDERRAYELSVEFYSRELWNTHLAHVLFEGDRMLKSLVQGFDIFHGEPVRSGVPGFATVLELAAQEPDQPNVPEGSLFDYGRIWIELDEVKMTTIEPGNTIVFDDFEMEVRAESRYRPMIQFAEHLEKHYDYYAEEFVIFAEVERAARVVAIVKWLNESYPDIALRIIGDAYDDVRVIVPRVIRARADLVPGKTFSLRGGVVLSPQVTYDVAPDRLVGDTKLQYVRTKVLDSRPDPHARAWEVPLGKTPRVAVLIGPPRG